MKLDPLTIMFHPFKADFWIAIEGLTSKMYFVSSFSFKIYYNRIFLFFYINAKY